MSAAEKIFGMSIEQIHADIAEETQRLHEQASRNLNSWLQYLTAEEIQGLASTAEAAARAEILRRQGVEDA